MILVILIVNQWSLHIFLFTKHTFLVDLFTLQYIFKSHLTRLHYYTRPKYLVSFGWSLGILGCRVAHVSCAAVKVDHSPGGAELDQEDAACQVADSAWRQRERPQHAHLASQGRREHQQRHRPRVPLHRDTGRGSRRYVLTGELLSIYSKNNSVVTVTIGAVYCYGSSVYKRIAPIHDGTATQPYRTVTVPYCNRTVL